jgi:hypothetical protein
VFAVVCACAAIPATAKAQNRRGEGDYYGGYLPNKPYDGRFTFARIMYTQSFGGGGRRGQTGGWWHDYPDAEQHFTRLLKELTTIQARTWASNILTLDDPELMKYPVAYMSEPGYWYPNENEVLGLRDYFVKGGFVIFDDFEGQHLLNLIQQMNRVLPGVRLFELDTKHPIFDAFYRVKSLEYYHPQMRTPSTFYGIFEDNDPSKRMIAIANHNNDIGDYWEWSNTGMYGIDPSNEAYKLGINYIIYAMTR